MDSIKNLFKIGYGPSSSHTMGPSNSALRFKDLNPDAAKIVVTLYGSLAATGKGHLTDKAILAIIEPTPCEIIWKPDVFLAFHPNGIKFQAFNSANEMVCEEIGYSVGGGAMHYEGDLIKYESVYELNLMEDIIAYCQKTGKSFWEYVFEYDEPDLYQYLEKVWGVMTDAVERGLRQEGVLPGNLGLARKAYQYYRKSQIMSDHYQQSGYLYAFSLAVAEENASAGKVVTAPTCGSSGVLPGMLYFLQQDMDLRDDEIIKALATAGLIGNLIKHNASISGAEVGCQGEIGAACSMAAAAANQLLGGAIRQIEYAAEIGLEHNLGLTCDPVGGFVQIPCIERNAFACRSAMSAALFSLFSDGTHYVTFDEVVRVMKQTGHDLPSLYKETSGGGLALEISKRTL